MSKRYALVIDLEKCVGCHSCTVTCKQENDLPPRVDAAPGTPGPRWNWVHEVGPKGTFPDITMYFLPVMCQHCEEPACVDVCPTGASYKREDGIVLIDRDKCIGCQYCVMACPYGARSFEEDEGVVSKCTLCAHRVEVGLDPACALSCIGRARLFGDLNDPESAASVALSEGADRAVRLRPDVGTEPGATYLAPKSGL